MMKKLPREKELGAVPIIAFQDRATKVWGRSYNFSYADFIYTWPEWIGGYVILDRKKAKLRVTLFERVSLHGQSVQSFDLEKGVAEYLEEE